MVRVHYREDVASHSGPESCGVHCEVCTEALSPVGDSAASQGNRRAGH